MSYFLVLVVAFLGAGWAFFGLGMSAAWVVGVLVGVAESGCLSLDVHVHGSVVGMYCSAFSGFLML